MGGRGRVRQCAICVEKRVAEHETFDGFEGLAPPVTTVNGTLVCAAHVEEARKRKCVTRDEVLDLIKRVLNAEEVA